VLTTSSQIHAIETCTTQGNQAYTACGQAGNHLGIQPVVDKGADRIHIMHQLQSVTIEAWFEITQLMSKLLIGTIQTQTVIILGIEDSNAHGGFRREVGGIAV
jgi:hypothetical protein